MSNKCAVQTKEDEYFTLNDVFALFVRSLFYFILFVGERNGYLWDKMWVILLLCAFIVVVVGIFIVLASSFAFLYFWFEVEVK